MAETMAHLLSIIGQLRALAAYLDKPLVIIAAIVLYLGGSMMYVVVSCRRHTRQQKRQPLDNHPAVKQGKTVISGERS
jgi:hypothetical protein